ncbi:GNAT family N-acetyltransferase [Paludibacteraceae bacterium OttesenSCG-928-F17]|nr:GNAT family N-acetyltransferase [Paludibacteraceae bacterium OttesenSCG-928-F17]
MEFKIISHNSNKYKEVVALRQKILRDPLGMKFSKEDLERDAYETICVCVEDGKIVGCNQLAHHADRTAKLRQMAVESSQQGKGTGSKLLFFAEDTARKKGYTTIELHARMTAKNFYLKNGYELISDVFTEVGIPHVKMKKEL